MQLYNIAKEKDAITIAITKLGNNALTTGCTHVLFTTSPEIDKKSGITCSRFAQLFMVDTLYTGICNRDYDNIREYLRDSYEVFNESGKE
jgi:DNA-binding MurR/RpiR family transcriptional regulator